MVLAQNPVAHFCFLSSVRAPKFLLWQKTRLDTVFSCGRLRNRRCIFALLLVHQSSIGESGSALLASSLQNFSAVGSAHSFSEAVFHLSLAFLGLVSSLHFRMHLTFAKYFPLRRFPLYIRKVLFVKGIFLFLNEKLGIFAFLFVNKL